MGRHSSRKSRKKNKKAMRMPNHPFSTSAPCASDGDPYYILPALKGLQSFTKAQLMPSYIAKPTPPTQENRWKLVDATMRRQGQQARGLIETLHTVQEAFGYLDEQALRYVAMSLRVPLSRAFGIATFYQFFHPQARR